MLTVIGYLQSGGVQGAIAKTAETVYRDMFSAEQQGLARNVFLRLTELGEGTEDTRRRASTSELIPRPEQEGEVSHVLRTLADARLVTIGEGTVEELLLTGAHGGEAHAVEARHREDGEPVAHLVPVGARLCAPVVIAQQPSLLVGRVLDQAGPRRKGDEHRSLVEADVVACRTG